MTYSQPITAPANAQQGLTNAVQLIINLLEAGNAHEALLQAVDLREDVSCKSNPYLIGKKRKSKKVEQVYHGDVNVD